MRKLNALEKKYKDIEKAMNKWLNDRTWKTSRNVFHVYVNELPDEWLAYYEGVFMFKHGLPPVDKADDYRHIVSVEVGDSDADERPMLGTQLMVNFIKELKENHETLLNNYTPEQIAGSINYEIEDKRVNDAYSEWMESLVRDVVYELVEKQTSKTKRR